MKQYRDYTPRIDDAESEEENIISVDPNRTHRKKRKYGENHYNNDSEDIDDEDIKEEGSIHQLSRGAAFSAQTFRDFAKNTTVRLITGIILGCLGVYLSASFVSYFSNCISDQATITHTLVGTSGKVANSGGEGGARLSELLINNSFGVGSIVIIFWLFAMTFKMFDSRIRFKTVNFTCKCIVALITISLIIGLITISTDTVVNYGGFHGREVNEFIMQFLGYTGAVILSAMMIAIFCVICLSDFMRWIKRIYNKRKAKLEAEQQERRAEEEKQEMINRMKEEEEKDAVKTGEQSSLESEDSSEDEQKVSFGQIDELPTDATQPALDALTYELTEDTPTLDKDNDNDATTETEDSVGSMIVTRNTIGEVDGDAPNNENDNSRRPWSFPPFDLLIDHGTQAGIDQEEQLENQEKIRKTLADFKIPITDIRATVGPTVTLYEIVPENGVKIARIRSLVDDIALSLAAIGVRIIAPIPGKGTVGIEVANKKPQIVSMRTIIKSKAFQQSHCKLPMALGSTIGGEVYIVDLAKMPHLLVAGATGQGKSVGLNAIITSLLYSRRPDELKFVLIDPKMVEFSLYSKIERHYLAKLPNEEDAIITDVMKVAPTLSSLCVEMDDRYKLLRLASVRNIEEYNQKYKQHVLNPQNGHRYLPYIVVIVDEFSDLIMQSGKEVERPIARLAQKARAVGMHVIIATQRPSTDVITGIIKSNFPGRIAFKVASWVDSKTILDAPGAQQLIGRGDMLINHNSDLERVQCALVETEEVEAISQYISDRPGGQGAYILPEPIVSSESESENNGGYNSNDRDPLYEEAARTIIASNQASTSSLQRRYSIGYNRAGKIMDQLERDGIVGPSHGGKPRSVLVDAVMLEEILSK